ncbi:hypothetical protein LXL04_009055 [Taraxacum kok-saghyz]
MAPGVARGGGGGGVMVVVVVVEIMVVVEILNHKILEKVNLLLFLLEDQTYWIKFQVTQRKGSSLKWSPMMSIFSDLPEVIRDITCILKTMFRGTWDSWKSIDKDDREAMWRLFKVYTWYLLWFFYNKQYHPKLGFVKNNSEDNRGRMVIFSL